MGGQFIVKLHRPVLNAFPLIRGDFLSQFGDAAFENDFVVSDKSLGGGEAVNPAGLRVGVLKEVTGTSPYSLLSSYYSLWVN